MLPSIIFTVNTTLKSQLWGQSNLPLEINVIQSEKLGSYTEGVNFKRLELPNLGTWHHLLQKLSFNYLFVSPRGFCYPSAVDNSQIPHSLISVTEIYWLH